jgi:hypothetical protein
VDPGGIATWTKFRNNPNQNITNLCASTLKSVHFDKHMNEKRNACSNGSKINV